MKRSQGTADISTWKQITNRSFSLRNLLDLFSYSWIVLKYLHIDLKSRIPRLLRKDQTIRKEYSLNIHCLIKVFNF